MNEALRIEEDLLGQVAVPAASLQGIHAARAAANFDLAGRPVHPELMRAMGAVKLACARAAHHAGTLDAVRLAAIGQAAAEVMEGRWDAIRAHVTADVQKTARLAERLGLFKTAAVAL